jgi:hypothetical protein
VFSEVVGSTASDVADEQARTRGQQSKLGEPLSPKPLWLPDPPFWGLPDRGVIQLETPSGLRFKCDYSDCGTIFDSRYSAERHFETDHCTMYVLD